MNYYYFIIYNFKIKNGQGFNSRKNKKSKPFG